MKKCVIIGGGVVGLFTAYFLAKKGHQVVVLDRSNMTDGCSYGNAGMIVPSHVVPLAQPGMLSKGLKWMFNSKSPFYVRPRLSRELFSWGRDFYQSATEKHVADSLVPLRDISLLSQRLYRELNRDNPVFELMEQGLLMLFQGQKVGDEEISVARKASELGLDMAILDQNQVHSLEQGTNVNCLGAVHYKSDSHLNPNALMRFLKTEMVKLGVEIRTNSEANGFSVKASSLVSCTIGDEVVEADEFIIATGAWSPQLTKLLDLKLRLLPGKGYSFNVTKIESLPTIPSILCEGKVAVTPMLEYVRFGGTMEITTLKDRSVNLKRVEGIKETAMNFYPDLDLSLPELKDVWSGFRPCTPNGMPIIQRHPKFSNAIIATGHGMMGLSLGPATGLLVTQLVDNERTELDLKPFCQST